MDSGSEKFDNESILYELLEYLVKKQDPELVKCKNDSAILSTTGTIKNALRYLNNRYSLPESISEQISLTLPWKFSIGDNGRLLAILQGNFIEIRRSKDEFSSVIGKASVPKDAFPQWRKIAWSPDGSILVLASSSGYLSFYNSLGNNIFNISPKTMSQNPDVLEAGDAISSMMFSEPKDEKEKWTFSFSIVTYSGLLKSYNISGVNGYKQNYEFSFGNFYRKGVNAFAFDKKHNLYIVAGNCITQNLLSPAANTGLTTWRPLNDHPYYKLSFTFEESIVGQSALSIWNLIPTFRTPPEPVIFRISISPSCNHLVCLHTDGSISLWNLPNLQLNKKWKLSEQPDHNSQNPLAVTKYIKFPAGLSEFHPVDIGWWSDHAIIVARYSGAVSVCSIVDLKNLLGSSPEFLSGQPQISEFYLGKGFLCLDCETIITSKKRNREPSHDGQISEASDSEKEEDELEPITLMNYTTNLVQSALYSITDIEKFQPKRRKSKILKRTYRILGLKSTTPEELYSRKIDIEEYDEALALATSYNLDKDLVYQTRWRKSEFSVKAIQDHLSKVSKRSWVLNECLMRVPETLDAARELLNFGLEGANPETFTAIAKSDDGKFVVEDHYEDNGDSSQVDKITSNLRDMKKINENLRGKDLSKLSQAQKDLISYRRKLLDHLDKLQTYEIIIEDPKKYQKEFYQEFRRLSALENAVRFAKDCDFRAVGIMFTYHGSKLIPHWLGIINCFPETLNPSEYRKLLPECDEDGQLFLLYQRELRPMDWAEKCEFDAIFDDNNEDDADVIYETEPLLSIYRDTELTMELLSKWYKSRAYQIERDSRIVENALELVKIGESHRISGLENLLVELETLDDLVYKIYLENMSLLELEKLSDLEKIKLLMSTSEEKNFVRDIRNYVVPFVKRKQKYLGGNLDKKLLSNYLVMLSEEDLKLPVKFFENVMQDPEILEIVDDIMALALNCIYSCTNSVTYEKAREIFDFLPKPLGNTETSGVSSPIEELEKELDCLRILNKYNVNSTVKFINENKYDAERIELLLNEMATNLKEKTPPPKQEAWSELLNDMLEIQGFIFTCVNIDTCFEICVAARLSSGLKANIQNCTSLIETKNNEQSLLKVSFKKAVELILEASKEYFNSCKSFSDPNMELARACLRLIEDENSDIQKEYDLINSLQILEEFNVNILPLHVRLCQDKLKLIENCLNNSEGCYKRQERLLTLASFLDIENNNRRLREGKVLELVASKALQVADFDVSSSICKQMIENNYYPAWKVCQQLGFCDEYQDLISRQKFLWFAITYGPSDILENSLKQMHLLEIQVLNKNLENWMTTHEIDEFKNEEQCEDDFTDTMDTPQTEVKEFVPKILETSTGLVKSSAQIFKNSTLGIFKNVSKHKFWETALNINSKNVWEDSYEVDEDVTKEKLRGYLQSFPFFYKSLHDQCLISRIDTKYSKYSVPDVNDTKLKMCQTLLRVSSLSETACYGLEISDINHFFAQSSGHIFADDWLLGLSYLLNLKDDQMTHANEVFENLPRTDLYIQTAIYYFSLELYRKLNPEVTKAFLIDPIVLMEEMTKKAIENEVGDLEEALKYWLKKLTEYNTPEVEQNEKNENIAVGEGWDHELDTEDDLTCAKDESQIERQNVLEENQVDVIEEGWDHEIDLENDSIEEEDTSHRKKVEFEYQATLEEEGWDREIQLENNSFGGGSASGLQKKNVKYEDQVEMVEEGWDHELEIEDTLIDDENLLRVEQVEEKAKGWDHESDNEDKLMMSDDHEQERGNMDTQIDVAETGWDHELAIDELIDDTDQAVLDPECPKVEMILEKVNLCETETTTMPFTEWNDNWDEFSDHSEGEVHQPNYDNAKTSVELEQIPISTRSVISDMSSEEDRFNFLQDLISKLEDKDDYLRIKNELSKCPAFVNPEFISAEKHLALKMLEFVKLFITKRSNSEHSILQEYKELLQNQIIPSEEFEKFIVQFDNKCDFQEKIFLRLCSGSSDLQNDAINMMKSQNHAEFPSLILEEIFFKNMSTSFPPHHPVYDKILETIFLNHKLQEIEPNIRILIEKLMEKKHVPYAVALWNQLAAVPPAMSTFESCFHLFARK